MNDPALKSIFGLGMSPDGIGQSYATQRTSGPGTGLEHMSPVNIVRGVGQTDSVVVAVTRSIITGVSGAVVGVALAPNHDKRTKYAVIGGLLGMLLGPLGIAGQALYVLSKE